MNPEWLMVAQVYATLAVAYASLKVDGTTDPSDEQQCYEFSKMARDALKAAGVKE